MSIVKVIEVIAQSDVSWEDAAQNAVTESAVSVRGISNIYIDNFQAVVVNDKITMYRVNAKVSFILDDRAKNDSSQP